MDLLARREHTEREVIRKLSVKVDDQALLREVVEQLTQDGLLSDERFTETYLRYRSSKGFGPIRIGAELREKGVAEHVIGQYLNSSDEKWYRLALVVKNKKFGSDTTKDIHEKARQMRFLVNRGFVRDQVNKAVDGFED